MESIWTLCKATLPVTYVCLHIIQLEINVNAIRYQALPTLPEQGDVCAFVFNLHVIEMKTKNLPI